MEQAVRGPAAGARRGSFLGRFAALGAAIFFASALGSSIPALAAPNDCPAALPAFVVAKETVRPAYLRADASLHILAIGSSSTQGVGASAPNLTYPAQLQVDLAGALGRRVIVDNAGVGGETISETLFRLKTLLRAEKPDLVIWQVGTNDAVRGDDEAAFRAEVEEGLGVARDAKIPLVLLDQQYFPAIKDIARYERFVRIVRDVAAEYDDPVFPRYSLMKKWGADSPDLLRAMLWKDGFHMSDRGYGCLARDLAVDVASLWAPRLDLATSKAAVSIVK